MVPSRPNGLPNAKTGSPTTTRLESASRSGTRSPAGASTWSTARSVDGSVPTTTAFDLGAVPEAHRNGRRAGDDVLVGQDVPCPVVDEAGPLRRVLAIRLPRSPRPTGTHACRPCWLRIAVATTGSEPSTVTCRTTVSESFSRTANEKAPRPRPSTRAATMPARTSGVRERELMASCVSVAKGRSSWMSVA